MGAAQVALHEGQLLLLDPLLVPLLQQLDQQPQAGRGVAGGGGCPEREEFTVSIKTHARIGAVGPAAFDTNLLHEASGEGAAEGRRGHLEGGEVIVVGVSPEGAQVHLGLGAVGLVDEDEVTTRSGGGLAAAVLDRLALGEPGGGGGGEGACALLVDVAREDHEGVGLAEHALVVIPGLLGLDGGDGGEVTADATVEGVGPEDLAAQGAAGEDLIVVPGLDDLGLDLPLELAQLDAVEGGASDELAEELGHGLGVAREHGDADGGPAEAGIDGELGAKEVDGLLDLLCGEAAAAAPQHAASEAGEPLLALGVKEGAGPEGQRHVDERYRRALFHDDLQGDTCLSPVKSSCSGPSSPPSSPASEARTRTTERASLTR